MLLLLFLRTAAANTIFPGVLYDHLGLEVAPQCTLCHQTLIGGLKTVDKPFGLALIDMGLEADATEAELSDLLDEMEASEVDSDGDGVGDIAELKAGTDPNVSGGTLSPPKYGCLSTTPRKAPTVLLGLLALGLARRRR